MIFRQLFEPKTCTYTYLLGCPETGQAALVDTVIGTVERDLEVVNDLGLKLAYSIETHVHADHLTGARKLQALSGSQIAGPAMDNIPCYDLGIEEGKPVKIGSVELIPLHTPGHTATHHSYVIRDATHTMVFTGDSLLIGACGRTDFQHGSSETLYQSITEKLFTLPDDTLVYPGHDYNGHFVSTIRQERTYNPRLGDERTLDDFIEIMKNLNLPKPTFMEFAVPGNMTCGQCPPNVPEELKQPCEIEVAVQG
jgi:glyoxylase-like metal-dependent hydrolase (beta-lactamase superfamily II)